MSESYYGLPTHTLQNDQIRLDFLTSAGPRIVRLMYASRPENLLAETPKAGWNTPYGRFHMRGGHRLWHGPEIPARTYVPDNDPITIEKVEDGVRLVQPVETPTGIRKTIEIRLLPGQAAVSLHHTLTNEGDDPLELSAWAITQLPLGGVAVFPQPVGNLNDSPFLPNRNLVLWPYTRWQDNRLAHHDDVSLLSADPELPPCKFGYFNRAGWLGYLHNGLFFIKRFEAASMVPNDYPDYGCNVESYCNDQFIEVETLGPLTRLLPGQWINHTETWELHPLAGVPFTLEAIRKAAANLNLPPFAA